MNQAIIFDIERNSYVDGPGIRTTIFFKGCNLRCAWCHNPESQSPQPQLLFYRDKCSGCGRCKEICENEPCSLCGRCEIYCPADARKLCGREYTADQLLAEILKDKAFYDHSGGGATFSGGECMLQLDFLLELLQKCKEHGIHTAVDTAGHIPFDRLEQILPYTDLFLYDVKCFDPETHKKYVGVDNRLILENLQRLLERGAKVWIRIPLIAGINDSTEELLKIKDFLFSCGKPEKIELLPYHAMGENKYRAIGIEPQPFQAPDQARLQALRELME